MTCMPLAPKPRPYRIALLNPNTNSQSTSLMMESALEALPAGVSIEGRTVASGEAFIADAPALEAAARAVEACGVSLAAEGFDAIIVAGFGDPGVEALRRQLRIPVTGLGEAGIAQAARDGLRYAIVTVTPELHETLLAAAHAAAPASQFAGVRYTQGAIGQVMNSPVSLELALLKACQEAIALDGAQSIVIGGGPLAQAARDIATQLHIRVVDPVSAAVALACARGGLTC
jgi:Asp/Glu/hydantoin racemase